MTKKFGDNTQPYPAEMRTQLWPLCCGAKIISGFKDVHNLTEAQLVSAIKNVSSYVPDHQVYKNESINPKLTFLTLNYDQMQSAKIMTAIEEAGFKQFATATPRGLPQGFFYHDKSNSFKTVA